MDNRERFLDDQATRALLEAASRGDVAAAEKALKDGADINFQHPHNGQSPLMAATLGGNTEVVAFLLK